jgi:hypothetical protein
VVTVCYVYSMLGLAVQRLQQSKVLTTDKKIGR